jgi:hypothetical protein
MKVACTFSNVDPLAKDECCALVEHGAGEVESCHRVLLGIIDEHPYLARLLLVFYRQAHEGYPQGGRL